MTIPCPVCHQTLQSTENSSMFMCARKKVYVEELNAMLDTVHCMIYLDDTGHQTLKVIEVAPYAFEMHDDPGGFKQTRIIKVVDPTKKKGAPPPKKKSYKPARTLERQTLIVVPGLVNCQWDDPKQVVERVKMYMLFS